MKFQICGSGGRESGEEKKVCMADEMIIKDGDRDREGKLICGGFDLNMTTFIC